MAGYTTVLLDIDQTLLDFNAAESAALRDAFAEMSLPVTDGIIESYHVINDALWKDFELGKVTKDRLKVLRFSRLIEAEGIDADAQVLQKTYTDRLATKGILLEGAKEFLCKASARYALYAVTNGISYVQKGRCRVSGIEKFFRQVFISEDVGFGKPDVRYFEYVLSRIEEKDKTKIAVVGDSLTSDIKGGINAGLDTCQFDPSGANSREDIIPCAKARSYDEILDFLG